MDTSKPREISTPQKLLAIFAPPALSWLLTLLCIYVAEDYGLALFVFIPLLIGASSVIIRGRNVGITMGQAYGVGFLSLLVYTLGLLMFAIEGLGCILMASPIGAVLAIAGIMIGYSIVSHRPKRGPVAVLVLTVIIPSLAFVEAGTQDEPELIAVTTSIDINASPEVVWKNVVEFPELPPPDEFMFTHGISYPIGARIEGEGVGAVRYCNFSTGSFVEPITTWDAPRLLQFSVQDCPPPMKEISPYDIDAPHLHDFFVSEKGQFRLIALPGGKTRLEGTTWYRHHISPAFYWQWWSDAIIHKIHHRVLEHIRVQSEK